jgi:hypothetical protein
MINHIKRILSVLKVENNLIIFNEDEYKKLLSLNFNLYGLVYTERLINFINQMSDKIINKNNVINYVRSYVKLQINKKLMIYDIVPNEYIFNLINYIEANNPNGILNEYYIMLSDLLTIFKSKQP